MPDYRPIRPRVRWGSGYTNELIFRTPLDEATAYSEPAEGSAFAIAPSGAEDAWIVATDYFLKGAARHIPTADVVSLPPATGWEGAAGWDAFLQWMREKNVARFYPDGRNLLDNPKLFGIDVNANGIQDEWASFFSLATATFTQDAVEQAAKVDVTASVAGTYRQAGLNQTVYGVRPGDTLSAFGEAKLLNTVGSSRLMVVMQFRDASNAVLSDTNASSTAAGSYQTLKNENKVAPAGTASVRVEARLEPTVAGNVCTGWFRNFSVVRATTAPSTFIDNPGYEEVYLVEPMRGAPSLESSLKRRVDLVLRKRARTAWSGY